MSSRITKWQRWMDVIKSQSYTLGLSRHVFTETFGIVKGNTSLPPSLFWDQLAMWHAHSVAMTIRRQLKSDSTSISLTRLLGELKEHGAVLTERWFCSQYEGSVIANLATNHFAQFTRPGIPHFDTGQASNDLQRLRTCARKVESYADRIVAHNDSRPVSEMPTYGDLDSARDLIHELTARYMLLLHASAMVQPIPTIDHDWKAVFAQPWLNQAT